MSRAGIHTSWIHVLGGIWIIHVTALSPLAQDNQGVHPLSGREYATTMDVSGAAWLERWERDQEEAPDVALRILQIEPGSTVADIGAGSGYFTVRLAALVGPEGRVYANDIQQGMLDLIQKKIEEDNIRNVTLVRSAQDNPNLPPSSVDLALMVDVYHEFSEPQAMLRHLHDALKPNGRLVLLEYRKEDPSIPILPLHKMSVADAKLEVEAEGFILATVNDELPRQHVLIFTKQR